MLWVVHQVAGRSIEVEVLFDGHLFANQWVIEPILVEIRNVADVVVRNAGDRVLQELENRHLLLNFVFISKSKEWSQ